MSVGTNIKRRRLQLQMSQQDLAFAMGYKTRSTIAKIESGENDVSQRKLEKFAYVLKTSVDSLISGNEHTLNNSFQAQDHNSHSNSKNVAIILAGGKSLSQQNIPYQFVTVNGKPIIVYSMLAYQKHPSIDAIYIVCLKGWENIVSAYASQYQISKLKQILPASSSGVASLKCAIDHIKNLYSQNDLVFIQEATRPMVHAETISSLLHACSECGSATICHSMKEYVQFDISENKAHYVNRNSMIALQSPEAHRLKLLEDVFSQAEKQNHPLVESCCTMLMHNLDYEINFLKSNINNIKIAREEDIAIFAATVK